MEPYLVMEYVPGSTLRPFCRADQLLPLELIVEIGFKCAMALGYVFRQGLIHRDVKPANILAVMDRDAIANVKLTDFGSVLDTQSDRTQVFRVGSLAYMSPEQLDGSALDARSDMFALAAVLNHLVAGRPPFDATHQAALMHQICNLAPPPLEPLREGVPPRMDEILQRALAKSPADRFASWDEFAQEWSSLVARHEVPRGALQEVLDSERFNLLRSLEFSAASATSSCGRWCTAPTGNAIRSAPTCIARSPRATPSTSLPRAGSTSTIGAVTSAAPVE